MVLRRTPMTAYAGRGAGAARAGQPAGVSRAGQPVGVSVPRGTCAVDVTDYLQRKLGALARHRTQYPVVPSMLPGQLLKTMLGTEFFLPTGGINAVAGFCRRVKVARKRPLPWTFGGISTPALDHFKSSLPILRRLRPWRGTPRPGEVSNG